jgi:hypothetical protein
MHWVWDTRRDAAEFAAALEDTLEDGLEARATAPGRYDLPSGAAATRAAGRDTHLVLAPDADTARAVLPVTG